MTDNNDFVQLINTVVVDSIKNHVAELLKQQTWQQSVATIAESVVAKTLSESQVLENNLKEEVRRQLVDQLRKNEWKQHIESAVAKSSTELVKDDAAIRKTIDTIATKQLNLFFVSPDWKKTVEDTAKRTASRLVGETLATLDFLPTVKEAVVQATAVNEDTIKKQLPGLRDISSQEIELVIVDGAVVAKHHLDTQTLKVAQSAEVSDLKVKNLAVTGTVNVDCESWQQLANTVKDRMVDAITTEHVDRVVGQVFEKAKQGGIEFGHITVDSQLLLSGGTLARNIKQSSLEKLGTLKELTVDGPVDLNTTVTVTRNRVGINTVNPDAALSVWDQEVAISIGKRSDNRAFVGTSRKQSLQLGVNFADDIVIDESGTTTVRAFRIGQNQIAYHNTVPGWSGTKGDFVINVNPDPNDTVFAWVCLGTYRWKPLHSSK